MFEFLDIDIYKEKVIDLYNDGKSVNTIAKDFNCSSETVIRRLNKWGVHIRTRSERFKGKKKSPEHAQKLRDNLNKQRGKAAEASKKLWSTYNGNIISRKEFLNIHRQKAIESRKLIVDNNGENNPNWKGGISKSYWRNKVLFRDKFTCQKCGYNECPDILETHHVNGNGNDNRVDNGITLCPNCHKVEEFKRKSFNTRGGER